MKHRWGGGAIALRYCSPYQVGTVSSVRSEVPVPPVYRAISNAASTYILRLLSKADLFHAKVAAISFHPILVMNQTADVELGRFLLLWVGNPHTAAFNNLPHSVQPPHFGYLASLWMRGEDEGECQRVNQGCASNV